MIQQLWKNMTGKGHELHEDPENIVVRKEAAEGMAAYLAQMVDKDFANSAQLKSGDMVVTFTPQKYELYKQFVAEQLPNQLVIESQGVRVPKELWALYEPIYTEKTRQARKERLVAHGNNVRNAVVGTGKAIGSGLRNAGSVFSGMMGKTQQPAAQPTT